MTRRRREQMSRGFYLALVDHDRRIFNLLGPVFDDDAWNDRIAELQRLGRNVNCSSAPFDRPAEEIIAAYASQTGYTHSTVLITDATPGPATYHALCQTMRTPLTGIGSCKSCAKVRAGPKMG